MAEGVVERSGALPRERVPAFYSTGPTRMWCYAPAMHRRPNARSRRCWSECGEHNRIAPEALPKEAARIDAPSGRPPRFQVG